VITSLLVAPVVMITLISTIVSSEASRYLVGTVVFRKISKMLPILIAVSVAIFFG
jgi:phage-related holin